VYSKHSTELQLLLFDHVDDERPAPVVPLDPAEHRSYHYWHVFVPGLKPGQVYAYRARAPRLPERGLTYDPDKVLLDPYARLLAIPRRYDARRPFARRKLRGVTEERRGGHHELRLGRR